MARWTVPILAVVCLFSNSSVAQFSPWRITISNKTTKVVYVAPYYVPIFADTLDRVGVPIRIGPRKSLVLERPYFKLGYSRYLLFDSQPSKFTSSVNYADFFEHHPKYIGALAANHVYLDFNNSQLRGYNSIEWYFWHPIMFGKKVSSLVRRAIGITLSIASHGVGIVKNQVARSMNARIREGLSIFWDTAHRAQVAYVRRSDSLSDGERYALSHRRLVVRNALHEKFGSIGYVPKIAILGSGGGYRAMFFVLGFLSGAQKCGLLDMITWMGGVSGSAWAINVLLTYALSHDQPVNIDQFCEFYTKLLSGKHIVPSNVKEIKAINNLLLVQAVEHQAFTSVNLAGALLANRLFSFLPPHERQRVHLSQQAPLIETGEWPIPIYAATHYDPKLKEQDYPWVEFTPWEIGSSWFGCYAPIWATGREFENGVSIDHRIEKSLGYFMGVFGSGFAAQVSTLYDTFKDKMWVVIQNIIKSVVVHQVPERRLWWGQMHNFAYGVATSPVANKKDIDLLDAGFAFNIPYPPLSGQRPERQPDILIIVDASTTIHNGLALKKAQQYAKKNSLKFPQIDFTDIGARALSIFKDPDPSVPIIIYFPRIVDSALMQQNSFKSLQSHQSMISKLDMGKMVAKGVYGVSNFVYTENEIEQLIKLAEYNLLSSVEKIFDEIKGRVKARSSNYGKK